MNLIGVKINEAIDANLLLQDLQDWPQVRDALRAVKEIVNTQTAYYLEWDDEKENRFVFNSVIGEKHGD